MVKPLALALGCLLAGCAAEPDRDVSVVLVSPDSLRADRLPPWNDQAAAPTPHLERLAARGTVFLNAWAASPWTAPSMVSIMTGLYPLSHGVAYRDDTTPTSLPTLPRLLASEGYEIGNFSFFSQISYFRNLGLGDAEAGLNHATVADSFGRWLGTLPGDQRFFAWVHLLETHLPYGASGYRAKQASVDGSTGLVEAQVNAVVPVGSVDFEPGDRQRLVELYDRDVAEMDRALGRVLAALEAHGRLENTLIVFVADHGEELLDHGWIGHASTSIEAKLVPEILRVPLILAGPGIAAGQMRRELVHQVDILPTVARLLGFEPPTFGDGVPLPGVLSGWRGWNWGNRRQFAFFDSSPGGNLTPRERRGERIQGLTDGNCLIATRVAPDAPEVIRFLAAGDAVGGDAVGDDTVGGDAVGGDAACGGDERRRLRDALGRWRHSQAEQRLAVLARHGLGSAPSSDEIDDYAEVIEVLHPRPGERLRWQATGGQVLFEWAGAEATGAESTAAGKSGRPAAGALRKPPSGGSYWIEYRLGRAPLQIEGSFQVAQQRIVFGPVPHGFWNDVAGYSPSRIRIADADNRQRSPWIEFEVLAVE